jgi:hypothetical protein
MPVVLEHRRSTREQAALDLGSWGGVVAGGIAALILMILFHIEPVWIWIVVGMFALVSLVVLWTVVVNRRANSEFFCLLDETRLHCHSPVLGPSFEIALADIERVESDTFEPEYHLVHRDGRRFLLTGNYGNPAGEFAQKICELTELSMTKV